MSEPDAAIRPMRRVMVLQRDLNDKPVPPHRKAAPTARAVARAEAALRAHGVEPVGPGGDDDVDNKACQTSITTQLIDIVGGAEALQTA